MIQLLRLENLLYRNKPVCSRTRVVHKAKLITTYGPRVVRILDLVTFYGKKIIHISYFSNHKNTSIFIMLIIRVKYLQYNYNSNHYYLPEKAPSES